MTHTAAPALGRIRWKRFAAIAAPAMIGAGALGFMTAQGTLASSFAVSGGSFKISAASIDGSGFAQYSSRDTDKSGARHPVQVSQFRTATIRDLCQSVKVGPITLRLNAGADGKPVEAANLVLDTEQLSADADFSGVEIGRDASTLDEGSDGGRGPVGGFGLQAGRVRLTGARTTAWATTAGTFKLNGLAMRFGGECF